MRTTIHFLVYKWKAKELGLDRNLSWLDCLLYTYDSVKDVFYHINAYDKADECDVHDTYIIDPDKANEFMAMFKLSNSLYMTIQVFGKQLTDSNGKRIDHEHRQRGVSIT